MTKLAMTDVSCDVVGHDDVSSDALAVTTSATNVTTLAAP